MPKTRITGYAAKRRVSSGVGRNGELRVVGCIVAGPLAGAGGVPLLPLPVAILGRRDLRAPWSSAITTEVLEA